MQNPENAPPNPSLAEINRGCLTALLGIFVALAAFVAILAPPIVVLAGFFKGAFAEPSINLHSFWDDSRSTGLFIKWSCVVAVVIAWLVWRRSKATALFAILLTAPLVAWIFIPTALSAWHTIPTATRAAYVVEAQIESKHSMRLRMSYIKEHKLRLSEWGGTAWFDANDKFRLSRVTDPFETAAGRIIDHGSVVCVDESRSPSGSFRLRNLRECDLVPHGLTRTPVVMAMSIDFISNKAANPVANDKSGVVVPETTVQWFDSVAKSPKVANPQWKTFDKGVEFVGGNDNPNSLTGYRIDWPFLKQDSAWEILSASNQGGTLIASRRGMPRLFLLDAKSSKWSELPVVTHLPYHMRPETLIQHARLSDDGHSIAVCYRGMCILLRSTTTAPLFNP